MDPALVVLVMVAVVAAFTVSASAGLGGSLVLVPALTLALGAKQGVALAALLLALNNVVKVTAYRHTLPFRAAVPILVLTMLGTFTGAHLLVAADDDVVGAAVLLMLGASLVVEWVAPNWMRRGSSPVLALAAGVTSGFSGTSGPLKGVAVRALNLDRLHLVGAASMASLAGDAVKTGVFADAGLLDSASIATALSAAPLMVGATYVGRRINRSIGEAGYRWLFWAVIAGYSVRLLAI